ncbi:substrate-binding domain-containing protein [Streptomyces longwoodensis]|uniref:sugar ABC transporter substrate-binding protein n=1 Tax=Streptomyces longwoodensis TaxID=68231 RepID=UPI003401FD49
MLITSKNVSSGRWSRTLAALVIGALALTVSACTSSDGSDSSSGQGAHVPAATAALAPYTGHSSAFPLTEPLSRPVPAGKRFVYLQCSAQACAVAGKQLAKAVAALHGTFRTVNSGANPSSAQAAVSSVLSMKPDVVFAAGIEPSTYGDGLNRMARAGIKIVTFSIADATKPYGITFNYMGASFYKRAGRLLADWVLSTKGTKANVGFYGVPEVSFTSYLQDAFVQEMKKHCAGCAVHIGSVGVATLGSTAPQRVVTDLQAHPEINTVVLSTGNLAAGVPAAMGTAGLKLATITFTPQAVNLQDIKDGKITAGLAVDYAVSVWTAVDAAARLLQGGEPTPQEVEGNTPMQLLTQKDITFDPTLGWSGFPDYAKRFNALWKTGS